MTTSAMQLDLFSHAPATMPTRPERTSSPGRRWPAATWIPASLVRSALAVPQSRIVAFQLGEAADATSCQIGAVALRSLFAHLHHTTQLRLTPAGEAVTIEM
ncbi:MAG TPA: hypothetical protein VGE07_05250 [Herpetosiphonaceae bacterium]